ncbi:MAG: phosphomannomutase [Acidimicrobiia bacterium]|nr:phosphomannomutase [Acidimicrobiia bacterium]
MARSTERPRAAREASQSGPGLPQPTGPLPAVAPPADHASLRRRVDAWLAADPDPDTRAELQELMAAGKWNELAGRFAGRLAFGTAGLRAEVGAGPLRMNRLVVRQAAAGLLRYVAGRSPRRSVRIVVGHDARHGSRSFATETAAVARAAGAEAIWYDRPVPTPVLAYAVRQLGADAGVMVTASHNPPSDNGYKVYLDDGAQIIPPHDERIAAEIATAAMQQVPVAEPVPPVSPDEVEQAYLTAISGLLVVPHARDIRVASTPLCGVGGPLLLKAFRRGGFAAPHVVDKQAAPDPDFPGLPFPNPEEPGVLDAVVALARDIGADLAVANDPDADRLGAAIPDASGWRALSGNEIGALLADHLLRHSTGDDRLLVASVVSSRLVERMAIAAGARFESTLTGFKWVIRPALAHPELRFLFGYEEALGYSVGSVVRDKDGISAALVLAEAVAELKALGTTPAGRLADLARKFGLHGTRQWSIRFTDRLQGASQAAALMERVRSGPPARLAGRRIVAVHDLAQPTGELPPADVVLWDLDDQSRIVFRPSGTEPKLKVYLEVVVPVGAGDDAYRGATAACEARLAELQAELVLMLGLPTA